MGKVNGKNTNGSKDLPVSTISEPRKNKITDLRSLINRIDEYSEDVGVLKRFCMGIPMVKDELSLKDFCALIGPYIIAISKSYPCEKKLEEHFDQLSKFTKGRTNYGELMLNIKEKRRQQKENIFSAVDSEVLTKKFLILCQRQGYKLNTTDLKLLFQQIDISKRDRTPQKNDNIPQNLFTCLITGAVDYVSFMHASDTYLDIKYNGKRINQEDMFKECALIIKSLYALLIGQRIALLQVLLNKESQNIPDIWKLAYEIGLIQGRMDLIESHLDPDLIEIHQKRKSSEVISKDWMTVRYKKIEDDENELAKLLEEPLKYAREQWEIQPQKIYHGDMARKLFEKYKALRISEATYLEKLKPIAREYCYSIFARAEFKHQYNITALCQAISADYPKIKINSPENTIAWLNEIIKHPNFTSTWYKRQEKSIALKIIAPHAKILHEHIQDRILKGLGHTEEDNRSWSDKMNRIIIEHTYPSAPKSLKHGLMRGWSGKSERERH